MELTNLATQLPKYQSHKQVWALKIKAVQLITPDQKEGEDCGGCSKAILTPEEARYSPFEVTAEYVNKHKPQAGGYFVQYKDGYCSFSPAKAFEEGYTKI